MTVTEPLTESNEQEIAALLEGHRIIEAETGSFEYPAKYDFSRPATGRLTLDDGTQLLVVPNEGCGGCSSGWYELEHLSKVDNIITSVRLATEITRHDEYGEHDQAYRLYVVADATEINALSIAGSDGNGYYGSGFELFVLPPGKPASE